MMLRLSKSRSSSPPTTLLRDPRSASSSAGAFSCNNGALSLSVEPRGCDPSAILILMRSVLVASQKSIAKRTVTPSTRIRTTSITRARLLTKMLRFYEPVRFALHALSIFFSIDLRFRSRARWPSRRWLAT